MSILFHVLFIGFDSDEEKYQSKGKLFFTLFCFLHMKKTQIFYEFIRKNWGYVLDIP
jgi:hypothetical protein